MRSKLPFILAALVLPYRGESQAREGGAWQLTTPRAVAVDQPSVTLELDALNVVRAAVVTFRPALYLRCLNEKLEAYVATGAVGGRSADYRTAVRLRWGDRPALDETWRRSTDYAAVFAPDPTAFIRQLLATPDVVLEIRSEDAGLIIARFHGEGLDTHLSTLRSKCPQVTEVPGSDRVYDEAEVEVKAELLSMPDAEYPPLLRRAGIQGTVIMQAVIDTAGRVDPGTLRVISSPNSGFNEPARNAAEEAVFRPARVEGRRVRARVRLSIEFRDR